LASTRFDKIDRNCSKKISKTAISQIFVKCPRATPLSANPSTFSRCVVSEPQYIF
jgi:hypothetical protein